MQYHQFKIFVSLINYLVNGQNDVKEIQTKAY